MIFIQPSKHNQGDHNHSNHSDHSDYDKKWGLKTRSNTDKYKGQTRWYEPYQILDQKIRILLSLFLSRISGSMPDFKTEKSEFCL